MCFIPNNYNRSFDQICIIENQQTVKIFEFDNSEDRLTSWAKWEDENIKFNSSSNALKISPNGLYLAIISEKRQQWGLSEELITLFNLNDKKSIEFPLNNLGNIELIDFTYDSKKLLVITNNLINILNNQIFIYDLEKKIQDYKITVDSANIRALSVSQKGDLFAIGDGKGKIIIYEFTAVSLIEKYQFKAHKAKKGLPVNSLAFSPNGKILASGGDDCKIKLWDPYTGQEVKTLDENSDYIIHIITFSPDGKLLASGDDEGYIKIWDIETGKNENEDERKHEKAITSLSFSPDGKTLVSGSKDKTIRIWQKC